MPLTIWRSLGYKSEFSLRIDKLHGGSHVALPVAVRTSHEFFLRGMIIQPIQYQYKDLSKHFSVQIAVIYVFFSGELKNTSCAQGLHLENGGIYRR